jgi:NADPH:quinone reductase-like Zn-dependent oxidoreductase
MSTHAAYQYTKQGRLSGTLEKTTRSTPTPGDEEILVKVKAAALNPVDQQL